MDRCWAFTRAYNEQTLMPYWVRHYLTFCERVIVWLDDETDDDTGLLAEQEGAEVRRVPSMGLDDVGFVRFAQERYREAVGQAQWVCWVDADEFAYAPAMRAVLDDVRALGGNCLRAAGYAMVADAPPSGSGQITDELRRGFPAPQYSKVCLFDPHLDVTWTAGKHEATVLGPVVWATAHEPPVKLLHYRYLGRDWCEARNARNYARQDETNKRLGHGREIRPGYVGDYSPQWYAALAASAQEVV